MKHEDRHMKKTIGTSLIISTYNWPQALGLCLQSVAAQSILPNEIIIADDGSGPETRAVVEAFRKTTPATVLHVWHEDKGFRLAGIRNKAIAAAGMEYIIQIDGDIILHKHFIKDHLRFARRGSFVSGKRVMIGERLSAALLASQCSKVSIRYPDTHDKINGLYLPCLSFLYERYRQEDTPYVRGCNMAFWREDLLKVNGYNEAMTGWGHEDNEISCRLINLGVKKRLIKYSAIQYHIHHPDCSKSRLNINDSILRQSMDTHTVWCDQGIVQQKESANQA